MKNSIAGLKNVSGEVQVGYENCLGALKNAVRGVIEN